MANPFSKALSSAVDSFMGVSRVNNMSNPNSAARKMDASMTKGSSIRSLLPKNQKTFGVPGAK